MLDEPGKRRPHQPVDLRRRKTPPQLAHDGDAVNDIAQSRQLDQQDFLEFGFFAARRSSRPASDHAPGPNSSRSTTPQIA